jgi:hypothetical protein
MLQEKYFVSKSKRIELYGEQLNRINEELAQRDLSEISTEKLFDMKMKTVASLKHEETEIRLKEKGTIDDTIASLNDVLVEWRA